MYIFDKRGRVANWERSAVISISIYIYTYIYIFLLAYIYIERERVLLAPFVSL